MAALMAALMAGLTGIHRRAGKKGVATAGTGSAPEKTWNRKALQATALA